MEVLLAISGKDFVLTAADDTSARSIVVMKRGEDKSRELSSHTLMLYSVHNAIASFTRMELAQSLRSRNPYHVNVLVAGACPKTGAPEMYWIDYISNMSKLNFAAHGHASYFCLSTMDRYWHDNLTEEEAISLLRKCLDELRIRFIGNLPNFFVKIVDKNGIRQIHL
ncbi:hypothetical protein BASA61_003298 [Batrachochytrium salamandrivorans]|nr:hypothetical protein BASA61_005708 [Batrachochytrium salamandrivorans]KAH6596917.1 hypothetical protein BASA61_003298 [Batrachochytrium salamandrivorans]